MTGVLRTVSVDDLVLALSPAAGPEAARARVLATLTALGLPTAGRIPRDDGVRALGELERAGGATGLAAASAKRRLVMGGRLSGHVQAITGTELERVVPRAELVETLSHAVGAEAAAEAVERAGRVVGFGEQGPLRLALAVLENIAEQPGPAAAPAAFAKARLLLR